MANDCPECNPEPPVLWRELPLNETLREFVRAYISPPKQYYPSMDAAMDVWGTTIQPEDLLLP